MDVRGSQRVPGLFREHQSHIKGFLPDRKMWNGGIEEVQPIDYLNYRGNRETYPHGPVLEEFQSWFRHIQW